MPYQQMKITGIVTREWTDKSTGQSKSLRLLEGKISITDSFAISDASLESRYKALIGQEVLVPYQERPKASGGMYRTLDPDVLPMPFSKPTTSATPVSSPMSR